MQPEKMTPKSPATVVEMVSDFRDVYARVARKLKVSVSMVSRVADGNWASTEIEAALHKELKAFKDKLNEYL
jgi:hypothetical protein